MKKIQPQWLYSFAALFLFVILAMVYNSPLLSGNKALAQPDIEKYKGSAKEMHDYEKESGKETYWSDAMFGGMPTYQTGAKYPNDWIKKVDRFFRFLPRPADYIFLLFTGFFLLGIILFKNWKYAVLGAALFAMCTYFFIIIEAGHNSKVHAIAYFAPLTAGVLLLYRKKYVVGFLLTAFFMALELTANHPQMTYYLGLCLLVYVVVQGIYSIQQKAFKSFFISSFVALGAIFLALGMNSTSLLATYEYGQASTRGKNDISLLKNDNPNGLDKDYITHWSYGTTETWNLFIPNFMGGGSSEPDSYKTHLKQSIRKNAQSQEEFEYYNQAVSYIPTYWGTQPGTSGPAYQGAVVILLFILGMFLVKGRYKWWLIIATALSIFLSWGKNMMWLTDWFIDYFPMYDKFRAVSSILVIAEFTIPLLGLLGMYKFFTDKNLTQEFKKNVLFSVGGGTVAVLLLFLLIGGEIFTFRSSFDAQLPGFMQDAIREDRISMFRNDTLRTLLFVVVTLALLLGYYYQKITHKTIVILGIAALSIIDLWGVDKRYLNDENYIPKKYVDHPFPTEMTPQLMNEARKNPLIMQIAYNVGVNNALNQIKKEDKSHYRIYNTVLSTFNETNTSYFGSSIGGYHGAKLQRYQNIIDIYFSGDSLLEKRLGVERSREQILNLLNTKYVVAGNAQEPQIISNPNAPGNAWFINRTITETDPNKAITKIAKIALKNEAIVNEEISEEYQTENSNIELVSYQPNRLEYKSNNQNNGFAVFSEVYYDKGWKATIDGTPADIVKTNYFMRGLEIPSGKHEIVFSFEPEVIQLGSNISLTSNILFVLLVLGGIFYQNKDNFLRTRKAKE